MIIPPFIGGFLPLARSKDSILLWRGLKKIFKSGMDKWRSDLSSALPHHHAMTGQLVWLVTGASRGLGLALCIQAAFRGDLVIATARDISRLDAALFSNPRIERARVYTLTLDISWPVDELTTVAARAVERWGRIDVVVSGHSLHTGIKLT